MMRVLWEPLGAIAAILFIVANAYYPAREIARGFTPWSAETRTFFKNYLQIHVMINLLGLLAVLFHGHYADESNFVLQASVFVTIWLTAIGSLMYYRVPILKNGHLRMLHSQQIVFFVWIALIFVGHAM